MSEVTMSDICFFCREVFNDEDIIGFTFEWDAFVHLSCVEEQAKLHNPEAHIILREWGESGQSD